MDGVVVDHAQLGVVETVLGVEVELWRPDLADHDQVLAGLRRIADGVRNAFALAVTQPAVSKHLRVLREAGLVEVRSEAQRRIYRLRTEPLRDIDEWLEPYRQLWASRLDDLGRHLDAIPEAGSPPAELPSKGDGPDG